ncbi:peptidoglycan recognition protein-like [Condylostylus longicornis]|uniref:peptidoglycan recognition protein-like n=1 Tax=Condylostylus longicornis TaxID=2530218 RepID=UPI00244E33B1|nr:peptidoglycan recognition protein-like [Condylostylus longicornis]
MTEWESLLPKESYYIKFPAEYVVVHHTMGLRCLNSKICKRIVQNIQIYSMNVMTLPDIKFNFLLGEDGKIYQGTGWFRKSFHTSDDINSKSISIAFIGDFIDDRPNNEAMISLQNLIKCGKMSGYLAKNYKLVAAFQIENSTKGPGKYVFYELQTLENFFNGENETT